MQRTALSGLAVSSLLCFVATACTDSGPPPASPSPTTTVVAPASPPPPVAAAAPTDTPPPATSVAASDPPPAPASVVDAGPDFFSCSADSDCVAVQTAGCCPTGRKEAVNKQSTDAYAASVPCEKKHRICPMYRVLDRRVPVCGNTSHKCEMVQPNEIPCGSGAGGRACPSGSTCDANGHCAAPSTTPTH